jgi:hypothetical protein
LIVRLKTARRATRGDASSKAAKGEDASYSTAGRRAELKVGESHVLALEATTLECRANATELEYRQGGGG